MMYFFIWLIPLSHCQTWCGNFRLLGGYLILRLTTPSPKSLPITVLESLASPLREAFPFTWAKSSIKYLGIQLTDWKTAFTWLGCVNILKMNILPRVLFHMQMLPVPIPKNFFTQLQSMLVGFICNGKKPRIAMAILECSRGGRPGTPWHATLLPGYSSSTHPTLTPYSH